MLHRTRYSMSSLIWLDGQRAVLRYNLYRSGRQFGIEVVLRRRGQRERARIRQLTASKPLARQWLILLHRNQVTPCTLLEIADEILGKLPFF